MRPRLPSLPAMAGLALLVAGCDAEAPQRVGGGFPDPYLERLQELEALRYAIEQHDLEQQRLNRLLGGDQADAVAR